MPDRDRRQAHDAAVAGVHRLKRGILAACLLEKLERRACPLANADSLPPRRVLAETKPAHEAGKKIIGVEPSAGEQRFGKAERHSRVVRPFAGGKPMALA